MITTELAATVLAAGTLLPLPTAVVQQPHWSDRTRTIIGFAVSLIVGAVVYVNSYGLDLSSPSKIVAVLSGVVVAAGAAYRNVWKPSGLAGLIESKTSPSAIPPDPEDMDDPGEDTAPDPDEINDGLPEEDVPIGVPEPEDFDDGVLLARRGR